MSSRSRTRSGTRGGPRPDAGRAEASAVESARDLRAAAGADPSPPRLLNIGYGNLVLASRIIAIVSPQSSPMRRLREEAGGRGKLIDATQGRRTRSILITDSDHVILSAVNPETIAARFDPKGPVPEA